MTFVLPKFSDRARLDVDNEGFVNLRAEDSRFLRPNQRRFQSPLAFLVVRPFTRVSLRPNLNDEDFPSCLCHTAFETSGTPRDGALMSWRTRRRSPERRSIRSRAEKPD